MAAWAAASQREGLRGRAEGRGRGEVPRGGAEGRGRGRRGHSGRAGALSRQMHRHGELVRVELAVAVDVREVPHLVRVRVS